nr:RNA-directed DNA polymerase, eukaryota [Tanacetum cinerariifolium]
MTLNSGSYTNKIDTVLKAITDRIAGALPSDTVKNLKLSTFPVLSTRSYPNIDPQCSNQIQGSINAVTIHFEKQSNSYDEKAKENEEEEKEVPRSPKCRIEAKKQSFEALRTRLLGLWEEVMREEWDVVESGGKKKMGVLEIGGKHCDVHSVSNVRVTGKETIFKNVDVSVSDNFIALYGICLPTNSKILIVVIYAP